MAPASLDGCLIFSWFSCEKSGAIAWRHRPYRGTRGRCVLRCG